MPRRNSDLGLLALERRSAEDPTTGCKVWLGRTFDGYGRISWDGRERRVHAVAYELTFGPVPSGKVLDHLCRNRACWEPMHLQAVTQRENLLRGEQPNMVAARTNTCHRGHSLDDAYINGQGHRTCRSCQRERAAVR
jgi:hypothetical protein